MVERNTISQLDHKDDRIVTKMYAVFQRSYQKEAELIGVSDFPPLQRTAQDLKGTDAQFFGCWENQDLIAVAELTENTGQLNICSLAVDPAHFRKGIASRLLNFLMNSFVWETALVETAVENTPAIALYKKFGFVEEKRWQASHGISKVLLSVKKAFYQGINTQV